MSTTEATLKPSAKGKLEAAHRAQRVFVIEPHPDFRVTLCVNLKQMPPALASHVNSFWEDDELFLLHADGDPVRAVAMRAAALVLPYLLVSSDTATVLSALSDITGWPRQHGISISSFEVPSLAPQHLAIVEESTR